MANAVVLVFVRFANGMSSPTTTTQADEHGCFRVGMAPGSSAAHLAWRDPKKRSPFQTIDIDAQATGAADRVNKSIQDATQLKPPGNVGVIRLKRAHILHVLVREPSGQPVPGAVLESAVVNAATINAMGVLGKLNAALERCRCQPAAVR